MADVDWTLTAHCCRTCLGRVVKRGGLFRCADCGAEAAGLPTGICGCGLRVAVPKERSLFRCGPNPRRTAENPAEVVILFGEDSPPLQPLSAPAAAKSP